MLEVRRQDAEHLGQFALLPKRRRHQVVNLIHDEKIPRQMGRTVRYAAGSDKRLQNIRLLQVVERRDNPGERPPGICIEAKPSSKAVRLVAVNNVERQGKLVIHFLLPLRPERRWRQDKDTPNAPADQEFAQD